ARRLFSHDDTERAFCLVKEAETLCRLAELGVEPREYPRRAVALCRDAQKLFQPQTEGWAEAVMVEGGGRVFLASGGEDVRENLLEAVRLYPTARDVFDRMAPGRENAGAVRVQEALARAQLGIFGVNPAENFRSSIKLFEEARIHLGLGT